MTDDRFDPFEEQLRASLRAQARRAPSGDAVVRRVLAETGADDPRDELAARRRRRNALRTWMLPLAAAGAVAALVGTLVGIENNHPSADRAGTHVSSSVPAPHRSHSAVPTATPTPPTPSRSPAAATTDSTGLKDLTVTALTFAGSDAWALGSATCPDGVGRCTALLRSANGGAWQSFGGKFGFSVPGVNAACAAGCVQHIRFANGTTGYAFGHDALFMTRNGGKDWTQQAGQGADALETLNDNVIAVRAGADPLFEQSAIGAPTWTKITSPAASALPSDATSVSLARANGEAVLLLGSATRGSSTLYRSTDAGTHWTRAGSTCPAAASGDVTSATSATLAAADGSVVLACTTSAKGSGTAIGGVTVTSTNGGTSFSAPPQTGTLRPISVLAAASARVQLAATSAGVFRSTDGGNHWTSVPSITGKVTFMGFESASVGRVVAGGGSTIWTTQDGGAQWTEVRLG